MKEQEQGHYNYLIPNKPKKVRALGRKPADPEKVGALLKLALQRNGIDKKLARYEFVNHWAEIVGEEIARRSRPDCIKGGILVVRVLNSVWAQELYFLKAAILKRTQQYIGEQILLKDVHFLVEGQI